MSDVKIDLRTKEGRERFVHLCTAIEAAQRDATVKFVDHEAIADKLAPLLHRTSLDQGTVSRWRSAVESACARYEPAIPEPFRQTRVGWQLDPAAKAYYRLWRQQLEEEALLQTRLEEIKNKDEVARSYVTVAAGESVKSSLLPHVARILQAGTPPLEIRVVPFENRVSFALLDAGQVDAVLAWDVQDAASDSLACEPVSGTASTPVAVMAPTHPLVVPKASPALRRVDRETVRRYPLVHPDIPAMREIVQRLERLVDVPVSAMPLPSIGYYLLTTTAVGVIPGWPWVIRDLARRFGVRCLPLAENLTAGKTPESALHCVTLRQTTTRARSLQAAVRQAVDALTAPAWEEVPRKMTPESVAGPWYFYYVTFGPNADDPKASWCTSTATLAPRDGADHGLVGELRLGPPFEEKNWALDIEAEVVDWLRGTLLLRTYRQGDREPGVSMFSKWMRPTGAKDAILIGINTCVNITGKLTASPAILSREELSESVREAFLRQDAVALLAPDLANEPAVSATVDYRPR